MKTLLGLLFVLILSSYSIFAQSGSNNTFTSDNLRNKRYCEIIVVKGRFLNLKGTVYNTAGNSDCPSDKWNAIDFDQIKKDSNARAVIKNGPRYFLMDKISKTVIAPPKSENFQGLEMSEVAVVKIGGKKKPYQETKVERLTTFVFSKGKFTYQLTSPKGTYVMQSYSQIIDPNLSEKDLEDLAKRLKLPDGWDYKAIKLNSDLELSTIKSKQATVIQDDLGNTYQKIK